MYTNLPEEYQGFCQDIPKKALKITFCMFSLEKPLMPAKRIIALQFARKLFKLVTGNDKIIRK